MAWIQNWFIWNYYNVIHLQGSVSSDYWDVRNAICSTYIFKDASILYLSPRNLIENMISCDHNFATVYVIRSTFVGFYLLGSFVVWKEIFHSLNRFWNERNSGQQQEFRAKQTYQILIIIINIYTKKLQQVEKWNKSI